MNHQLTSILERAKTQIIMHHPFYAAILLSDKIGEDTTMPTAYTDGRTITINPEFIASLPQAVVVFVLLHEALHIVLKHPLRLHGRDHERWNIACDYKINAMLKDAGITLWEHCWYDKKYDGMTEDQIYEKLPKGVEGGGGGLGNDLREPEGLGPDEMRDLEHQITRKIAQAATMARMQGKLPGYLERLVGDILNPKLSWLEMLRHLMVEQARNDECWSHRDRRFRDFYLPSHRSEAMGELVIIGDTSGSIGNEELAQAGAEFREMAEMLKPSRIRVVWADDEECAGEQVFELGDEIVLQAKGGGGTDMRKPCLYVERFNPIVVIMFTDGWTPWPENPTPYPLIIVCSSNAQTPSWASTVRI